MAGATAEFYQGAIPRGTVGNLITIGCDPARHKPAHLASNSVRPVAGGCLSVGCLWRALSEGYALPKRWKGELALSDQVSFSTRLITVHLKPPTPPARLTGGPERLLWGPIPEGNPYSFRAASRTSILSKSTGAGWTSIVS